MKSILSAAILTRLRSSTGKTHFWQLGGGYDRNVIDRELIEKIRYIHANPIRRGLSDTSAAAYQQQPNTIGRRSPSNWFRITRASSPDPLASRDDAALGAKIG